MEISLENMPRFLKFEFCVYLMSGTDVTSCLHHIQLLVQGKYMLTDMTGRNASWLLKRLFTVVNAELFCASRNNEWEN